MFPIRYSRVVLASVCAAMLTIPKVGVAQIQAIRPDLQFKGRFLVVASDTDMVPSAYTDHLLGSYVGPDELSVLQLNQPAGKMTLASVSVPNSVIGPPSSIALTPDCRYAVVVETRGQRTNQQATATLSELPTGKKITLVELMDPGHPKVIQTLDGYDDPLSVSINATGTLAAVVFKQVGPVKHPLLALYPLKDGRLSAPVIPEIPGPSGGDALVSAEFHPKHNVLGLLYTQHPRLSLVRVNVHDGEISLLPWGAPIDLDVGPFLVRFTSSGRFALVNAMLPGAVRGTVTSIQLEQSMSPDGLPSHGMISRAEAGILPEGFAISPDEHWVATTNLEHSPPALTDPNQGLFASVTLLRFDGKTGFLERVGEFPFDGRLPEAVVFDDTSHFLAVACFAHYDPSQPGGAIDFWRIVGDPEDSRRAALVKLDFSIPVARGIQSMVIARSK